MKKENMAADAERRLHPAALFCLRVNASAMLLPGSALVVHEYYQFRQTLGEVIPMVFTGRLDLPPMASLAWDCGAWAVVVPSAGVMAAMIYIWSAVRRGLPLILATVGAASLCVIAGNALQVATVEAWKWGAARNAR